MGCYINKYINPDPNVLTSNRISVPNVNYQLLFINLPKNTYLYNTYVTIYTYTIDL